MPGMRPITIFMSRTRQAEVARAGNSAGGREIHEFQSRQRLKRFDGGAGRVAPTGSPVIQRPSLIILQGVITFLVDTLDEGIRIVTGLAGQSQNLAIGRVDGDDRATVIPEGIHGGFLQADVQG